MQIQGAQQKGSSFCNIGHVWICKLLCCVSKMATQEGSLYTVIPNGEGLLALKHFFDQRTDKEPKSETK